MTSGQRAASRNNKTEQWQVALGNRRLPTADHLHLIEKNSPRTYRIDRFREDLTCARSYEVHRHPTDDGQGLEVQISRSLYDDYPTTSERSTHLFVNFIHIIIIYLYI